MKTTVELTGYVHLAYNERSKEFKEALAGYRKCIDPNGDEQDMLHHVAFYITRFGHEGMVEGVGYIGYDGTEPTEKPYSGIMALKDYDEFEFRTV